MNERPVIPCQGCTDNSPDYDDRVHWTPHTFVGESRVDEGEPCNLEGGMLMRRGKVASAECEVYTGPAWRQMFRCDRCGDHRQFGCTEQRITHKNYAGRN